MRQSSLVSITVFPVIPFTLSTSPFTSTMAYTSLKQAAEQQLAEIRSAGLYKTERQILSPQSTEIRVAQGEVINLCANNYLGLANHPEVKQAAENGLKEFGYGMASVRFICGTQRLHKQLEQAISTFFRHRRQHPLQFLFRCQWRTVRHAAR
jgi:hypothetical protein